jgi:hypothetical protein
MPYIPPKGPAENFGHSPHDVSAVDLARNDSAMMDARKWRTEVASWLPATIAAHGSEIGIMCLAAQIHVAYVRSCQGDVEEALSALSYMVACGLMDQRSGSAGGWDAWASDMEKLLPEEDDGS